MVLVLTLGLLLFSAPTEEAAAQVTTFSDGTFNDADWSMTVFASNGTTVASFAQVVSGGEPGEYQQISHTLEGTPSTDIRTIHINTLATYGPSDPGVDSLGQLL